jgi:hypothetical protein
MSQLLNIFLQIITSLSKSCTSNRYHSKLVNISAMLKMYIISIWDLGMPKSCQTRNAIIGDYFS